MKKNHKEGEIKMKKGNIGRLIVFIALLACTTTVGTTQKSCKGPVDPCDQDGDGYKVQGYVTYIENGITKTTYCRVTETTSPSCSPTKSPVVDCDDHNALVYPGAPEICDGLDNNCDKIVPANESDQDGDGFLACEECNDGNASVYPGAEEICNGLDDNCDQVLLEGETEDADGDGYLACADCNDNNAAINPGAEEVCDGIDNNCDDQLLAGETEDKDCDGLLACADDNDLELEASVIIQPRAFNENTGKFTAFITLPCGADIHKITSCIADGAPAIFINFDDEAGVAICKFNRADVTEDPLDTYFEVSGTLSDGFSFWGEDTIDKIVP